MSPLSCSARSQNTAAIIYAGPVAQRKSACASHESHSFGRHSINIESVWREDVSARSRINGRGVSRRCGIPDFVLDGI